MFCQSISGEVESKELFHLKKKTLLVLVATVVIFLMFQAVTKLKTKMNITF